MVLEAIETSGSMVDASRIGDVQQAQRAWDAREVCARCSPDNWRAGERISDQTISCVDLPDSRLRTDKEERITEIVPGRVNECPLKQALERQTVNTLLKGVSRLNA